MSEKVHDMIRMALYDALRTCWFNTVNVVCDGYTEYEFVRPKENVPSFQVNGIDQLISDLGTIKLSNEENPIISGRFQSQVLIPTVSGADRTAFCSFSVSSSDYTYKFEEDKFVMTIQSMDVNFDHW